MASSSVKRSEMPVSVTQPKCVMRSYVECFVVQVTARFMGDPSGSPWLRALALTGVPLLACGREAASRSEVAGDP